MARRPEESTVPRPAARVAEEKTPPAAPSQAQLGRYELLFQLARGGMGSVHVGRLRGAHGFDRLVAIKRLSATGATDEETASFLAEARLTARLSHSNVVQTLDLGEHEGSPFLVMQLVQGVSLARLLRRLAEDDAALEPELAAWICAQVASGLHAAHELEDADGNPLGLVHRDVSPENVLLSWEGRVSVADFGVAKFAGQDRATRSGVVKGKFAYMSPEQTRASALDRRSDIFSVGVLLHESLTGRRLFAGESPADTIRRVVEVDPPDPASIRPDVPQSIAEVALRCLRKKPDERFSSASDITDALRRALREGRAMVDESDLAALLERYFADERRRLRDRLRAAAGDGMSEGTPRGVEAPADEGGGTVSVAGRSSEHGSVTAAVGTAPVRSRRIASTTAVVAVVGGLGVAWWFLTPRSTPSPVAAEAASTQVVATSSVPERPVASAPPAPVETTAPPPPTASAARPASEIRRVVAPKIIEKPAIAPQPPPSAPAASPSPSHGGVPFRDL